MIKFRILLIILSLTHGLSAQSTREEKLIAPGVVYSKVINAKDTLSVNIIKIDLSTDEYKILSVKANNKLSARETTTSMVKTLSDSGINVIAAINADFFEVDGEVIGNMVSDSKYVKAVKFTDSPYNSYANSQFAITSDSKPLIEQFVFSGSLIFPDGTIETISRINSKADSNSITLYNLYQGKNTPSAPENWVVNETKLIPLTASGDTLFYIVGMDFHSGGNLQIPENGYILSANNSFAYYLKRSLSANDTVKVLLRLNPHHTGITSLTGGWPLLVKNGINVLKSNPDCEGVIPRFSENRHPRTGIGYSEDSTIVYFITVDGRQQSSRGMSLVEFANLMIDEGIFQGLNLDGGGSTTMIINNEIVNSPSDKEGERSVGNCLVLISKD